MTQALRNTVRNAGEFIRWAADAAPGQPVTYHIGMFGKQPVDLTEYVLRPAEPGDAPDPQQELTAETIKAADTSALEERLALLRRRREEEGRG